MTDILQAKLPAEPKYTKPFQEVTFTVRELLNAAEQGNTNAQFDLGIRYLKGEGVSKSLIQAAQWFRTAAESGHIDAQYQLGARYENGEGVPQDRTQAFQWYNKAAKQGQKDAYKRIEDDRHERYKKGAQLLRQWMEEEPEDDENVWPQIQRELERERYGE